jgi:hypothetical protein
MNYLSIVSKHIELAEVAYGNIKTEETRLKAKDVIIASLGRMGMGWVGKIPEQPRQPEECAYNAVSVTVGSAVTVEGVVVGSVGEVPLVCPETAVVGVQEVEMIGGWPERAVVTLTGLAPNRRMMRGRIGDGRVVCVERGLGKPTSGDHNCRIIRAGVSPLYRMVW